MKSFLDRILPIGGKKKAPHPKQAAPRRPARQESPAAPASSGPSGPSLAIPDLTGMNEKQRREALINHALKVKRARVALVQNLDERSQKVLRLMAQAMASKLDNKVDEKVRERLEANQAKDDDAIKRGQDLHAAMQAARKILDDE